MLADAQPSCYVHQQMNTYKHGSNAQACGAQIASQGSMRKRVAIVVVCVIGVVGAFLALTVLRGKGQPLANPRSAQYVPRAKANAYQFLPHPRSVKYMSCAKNQIPISYQLMPRSTATSKSLLPPAFWPLSPSTSRIKASQWSATTAGPPTKCVACATARCRRTWSRAGRAVHPHRP
jgi:hypothetical protein